MNNQADMNDQDVFELDVEDLSETAWDLAVPGIVDEDSFDSCGCALQDCTHIGEIIEIQ
jgi:hypothetical protein